MTVHVLAILKGAVEGDPYQHFAAFGGFDAHAAEADRLGLIGDDLCPTDLGRRFYVDANLASLPAGRANQWGHAADRALDMLDELEKRADR